MASGGTGPEGHPLLASGSQSGVPEPSLAWELVRNTIFQALPQDLLNQKLEGRSPEICVFTSHSGSSDELGSLRTLALDKYGPGTR